MQLKWWFWLLLLSALLSLLVLSSFKESLVGRFATDQKKPALRLVAPLGTEVKETSGLLYWDGHLLTHNDQGGKAELYVLDTLGKLVNTIALPNAHNHDWEDLAQSHTHLFIGDFGNNDGDRKNLQILKIKKAALNLLGKQTTTPAVETISFSYPEQEVFEKGKDHNFDCEAFFYLNGQLYLFTKNRKSKSTTVYQLPANAGTYKARKIQEVPTEGKVTGADISPDGSQMALTLYQKKGLCYLWQFSELKAPYFFGSDGKLTELGSFEEVGQLEGVAYGRHNQIFLSAEKLKPNPARLYVCPK